MAHLSINGVKARGNELTGQAVERGSEFKTQVLGHGSQAPMGSWAKLAGSGLALIRARAKDAELVNQPRKVSFQVLTLVSGVLGGALAGVVFNRIWRAVSGAEQAPEPFALDHSMREVLVAGALQGAVFGLVKAAVGRLTAQGYQRFTKNPRS